LDWGDEELDFFSLNLRIFGDGDGGASSFESVQNAEEEEEAALFLTAQLRANLDANDDDVDRVRGNMAGSRGFLVRLGALVRFELPVPTVSCIGVYRFPSRDLSNKAFCFITMLTQ
jgi:hypothetical protein